MNYEESGVSVLRAKSFTASLPVQDDYGTVFLAPYNGDQELVITNDGVGSKLLVARALDKYDTIGIDLVAMSVNDLICKRAKPLVFTDYIACHQIDYRLTEVIKGILKGCEMAGCSLAGGETAEVPSIYRPGDIDLAGCAVGVRQASKSKKLRSMMKGDVLIGLHSNGLHSNGYSLANKLLPPSEELLIPTKIYVHPVLQLIKEYDVLGLAHITGGGLYKIERILDESVSVILKSYAWKKPRIFDLLEQAGAEDMYKCFNMGIGFVVVVRGSDADSVHNYLSDMGVENSIIGEVVWRQKQRVVIV